MGHRVVVVGAGVIGLSCAVRLAEAGHEVAVLARDLPLETTSAVAAALWYPYRAAPVDRVDAWSATSYRAFASLAETEPDAGVRLRWGTELLQEQSPVPSWAEGVVEVQPVDDPRPGYVAERRMRLPVVDMGDYLPWLVARLERLGGTVSRQALSSLPDRADVVVNAAGLGARRLADDLQLTPIRGQVVIVEQIGLKEWTLDGTSNPDAPVYVVPRLREIVVGGTAQVGDWERQPSSSTAERILRDASQLVPGIAAARVRRHRVALRPARPEVRLDASTSSEGRLVVHCYGHGGSGVTVSWGCADEVASLVEGAALEPRARFD